MKKEAVIYVITTYDYTYLKRYNILFFLKKMLQMLNLKCKIVMHKIVHFFRSTKIRNLDGSHENVAFEFWHFLNVLVRDTTSYRKIVE